MKKIYCFLALLGLGAVVNAQVTDMGGPVGWKGKTPQKSIPSIVMTGFDLAQAQYEDSINDANKVGPWRFGYEYITNYPMQSYGNWITLPNGDRLWRTSIKCPGAQTINLQFSNFHMPEGGYLYLYDVNQTNRVGAYTSKNNNSDGLLGTELVHGEEIIVEYYEPIDVMNQGNFDITMVVHGYRSAKTYAETLYNKGLNGSGDCNVDVNCPLGAGWSDQIRAVGMLINGGGFCSGALINNTCDDGTGYFLTANHCGTASGSWNVRWNWESPVGSVSCATTANSVNPGPPYDQTSNGCTQVVSGSISDFSLISINNFTIADAQTWNLFYAGWDNSDALTVTSITAISHPSGDLKKIAVDLDPPTHQTTSFNGNPNAQMWYVANYENGVTEPGSSGCPLYDQNGRIIGDLSGGSAACSGTNDNGGYDIYGRFGVSWNNGVSTYLAPGGCGSTITNDGFDPNSPNLPDDAGIQSIISPTGLNCSGNFTPEVTLRNFGANTLTSVTINYDVDAGTNNTFSWTGSLASGATTNVTLPSMTAGSGAHVFNASTSLPNGVTDSNNGNDASSSNFTTYSNGQAITLDLITDCWGSETTWEIQDINSNVIVSGGPYQDVSGGELITVNFCLDPGCYDFIINDSYGDGMHGAQWGGCSVDGDYTITQDNTASVLASILATNSDFGSQEVNNFCVAPPCSGVLSSTTAEELCFGDNNGSVTVSVAGGAGPFTYDIGSGGQGSGTFANLSPGSYTITVTDNNACTDSISVILGGPPQLTTSSTVTDETCPGVNDGQIDVTATGGTAPLSYNIGSGVQSNSSFTGLSANTYNLTVTDANGCTATENGLAIATGSGVTATVTVTDISCNGLTDAEIQVNPTNGSAPYSYDIGSGSQANNTFTGLGAGNYTVDVTDNNGCTGQFSGTVIEPVAISGSYTTLDEMFGNDGSIDLSVNGGTSPYNYNWSGPNSFSSSNQDPSGLTTGSYNVTITDGNGCSHTISGIELGSQVGLSENVIQFVIYPNPSTGMFTVKLIGLDDDVHITITDVTGRIVYTSVVNSSMFAVDLSDKAEGTYFMQLSNTKSQTTKAIVLQH